MNYTKGYPLGPLAEEYAAKIAPKAKTPGFFKLPVKKPTHMEFYEEDALAEILSELIQIDKDVELRKNQLSLMSDFNLHDLFAIFDHNDHRGRFNFREFKEIFDLYQIYPSPDHLRLAFLNIDRDLDSEITLHEFLEGFAPKDKNYKDLLLRRGSYN